MASLLIKCWQWRPPLHGILMAASSLPSPSSSPSPSSMTSLISLAMGLMTKSPISRISLTSLQRSSSMAPYYTSIFSISRNFSTSDTSPPPTGKIFSLADHHLKVSDVKIFDKYKPNHELCFIEVDLISNRKSEKLMGIIVEDSDACDSSQFFTLNDKYTLNILYVRKLPGNTVFVFERATSTLSYYIEHLHEINGLFFSLVSDGVKEMTLTFAQLLRESILAVKRVLERGLYCHLGEPNALLVREQYGEVILKLNPIYIREDGSEKESWESLGFAFLKIMKDLQLEHLNLPLDDDVFHLIETLIGGFVSFHDVYNHHAYFSLEEKIELLVRYYNVHRINPTSRFNTQVTKALHGYFVQKLEKKEREGNMKYTEKTWIQLANETTLSAFFPTYKNYSKTADQVLRAARNMHGHPEALTVQKSLGYAPYVPISVLMSICPGFVGLIASSAKALGVWPRRRQ